MFEQSFCFRLLAPRDRDFHHPERFENHETGVARVSQASFAFESLVCCVIVPLQWHISGIRKVRVHLFCIRMLSRLERLYPGYLVLDEPEDCDHELPLSVQSNSKIRVVSA